MLACNRKMIAAKHIICIINELHAAVAAKCTEKNKN
ncbi:hypothetical protein KR059_001146 [Drosophila kikkawai]|nr:hypothetical protein KR059_001146 [Drosophila kikkawai]